MLRRRAPGSFDNAQFFPQAAPRSNRRAELKTLVAQSGTAAAPAVSFCNTGHWAATNWFVMSEIAGNKSVGCIRPRSWEWSQSERTMETSPSRLTALMRTPSASTNKADATMRWFFRFLIMVFSALAGVLAVTLAAGVRQGLLAPASASAPCRAGRTLQLHHRLARFIERRDPQGLWAQMLLMVLAAAADPAAARRQRWLWSARWRR